MSCKTEGCEGHFVTSCSRFKGEDWWYFIKCHECGVTSHWRKTTAEAWDAWNADLFMSNLGMSRHKTDKPNVPYVGSPLDHTKGN